MLRVPAQSTAVLLVALLTSSVAQSPNSHLSGRVTDWHGCPLQGAKVTVGSAAGAATLTGTTDAAGSYEIRGVPRGRAVVTATLLGFADVRVETTLFRGSNLWDAGLLLGRIIDTAPHRIAGIISGSDGEPLANATITLWNVFSPNRLAQTVSDQSGRFAVETLDSGQFIVSAVAPKHRAAAQVVIFDFDDGKGGSIQFRLERSTHCDNGRGGRVATLTIQTPEFFEPAPRTIACGT